MLNDIVGRAATLLGFALCLTVFHGVAEGDTSSTAGLSQPETKFADATLAPETTAGWQKSPSNPVLGGKLGTCFDLSVLREGETFRMWFSWRPKASVALTESTDGVHWSEPTVVLSPNPATDWEQDINRPVVLKKTDGYHMWYTGQARGRSWIGYATSQEGRTWKRMSARPVLAPEAG